ncbi:hypothetical protein RRSWK_00031 [Rhodopirellula sp. SWK7]|nr:hypothetical protein RRSWK_00031 [Rhodopirellula sp. SWK7]
MVAFATALSRNRHRQTGRSEQRDANDSFAKWRESLSGAPEKERAIRNALCRKENAEKDQA